MRNTSMLQHTVITPNIKKTLSNGTEEADGLPNAWRLVKLGEVYKFTKKPKELRYSEFDKIPFVPMDLLPIGSTSFEEFILKSKEDISSGTYFESGDLLVSKITPSFENGKQGIIEKLPTPFGIATTEVIPIKEIEDISDKYYLFYYLLRQDIRAELARKMEGSTGRQRLNISTLADLELPLPPLPQQIAIAKVLQTVQEAIQTRQNECKLEHECKAALMDYLFLYGIGGEQHKQTEIGDIPKSWRVLKLEDIITLQRGRDLPVQNRTSGEIPVIGSSGVVGWHNEAAKGVPLPGVATGRSGSIGLLTYIDQPYWPLNTVLYVSNFKGNDPRFLYYWLQLFDFNRYSQGVSVPTLNRNHVYPVLFPLPSLPEQQDIANVFLTSDFKINALEQESLLLEELFNSLLEELMTGQLLILPLIEGGAHE